MRSPNSLRFEHIPSSTRCVIEKLAQDAVLSGFCLIGGTALALQIGHRRSLDVDLICFADKLDKNGLFHAMLKHDAELITPQSVRPARQVCAQNPRMR